MNSTSPAIHTEALRYLGITEVPGPQSNPVIAEAIRLSADWLDRDDSKTSWCGCVRGLIGIRTGTGAPPRHYRAANWSLWGTLELDRKDPENWEPGDTVVVTRPGGHHVAIFHEFKDGRIYLIGGNQSDAFNIKPFANSAILHVRRSYA